MKHKFKPGDRVIDWGQKKGRIHSLNGVVLQEPAYFIVYDLYPNSEYFIFESNMEIDSVFYNQQLLKQAMGVE